MLLNEVATFARVVELKSISAAARSQGLSVAAASSRIMRLEQSLGVCLLSRSNRRSSPTKAGKCFYAHALEVLGAVEEARSSLVSFTDAQKSDAQAVEPEVAEGTRLT